MPGTDQNGLQGKHCNSHLIDEETESLRQPDQDHQILKKAWIFPNPMFPLFALSYWGYLGWLKAVTKVSIAVFPQWYLCSRHRWKKELESLCSLCLVPLSLCCLHFLSPWRSNSPPGIDIPRLLPGFSWASMAPYSVRITVQYSLRILPLSNLTKPKFHFLRLCSLPDDILWSWLCRHNCRLLD